jgi:hypothetical protein
MAGAKIVAIHQQWQTQTIGRFAKALKALLAHVRIPAK